MRIHNRTIIAGLVALLASSPVTSASPPQSVLLDDYTSPELRARIDNGCPVVLVMAGGHEETGPHLTLGKHGVRVIAYAQAIARNIGDALVAPPLPYAPNPDRFTPYAGTISLSPDTFARLNEEIARSLIAGGFRRIALLGDHGGGQQEQHDVAAKLEAEFGPKGIHVFHVADGYAKARKDIEAEIRASGHVAGGHGGLWDTAETLAIDPRAVRTDKLHAGDISEEGNGPISAEGFSGDPRPSTPKLGRHFADIRIAYATRELQAYLDAARPCR